MSRRLIVDKPGALELFLRDRLPEFKRVRIQQLLKHESISVNGVVCRHHAKALAAGDVVTIAFDTPRRNTKEPEPAHPPIVYEDGAILVANKPAGLLSIASAQEKTRTAYFQLTDYIRWRNPASATKAHRDPVERARIFIVHRLDRDTSGLIVFALTEQAKLALQKSWAHVEKKYYAVVEGTPKPDSSLLEHYLHEDKNLVMRVTRDATLGQKSLCRYKVVKRARQFSLLDVELLTGRKNQIRAQLAAIGHPIAGDLKYGARLPGVGRMGLHAHALSFNHPVSRERLTFTSPLPRALGQLLR